MCPCGENYLQRKWVVKNHAFIGRFHTLMELIRFPYFVTWVLRSGMIYSRSNSKSILIDKKKEANHQVKTITIAVNHTTITPQSFDNLSITLKCVGRMLDVVQIMGEYFFAIKARIMFEHV